MQMFIVQKFHQSAGCHSAEMGSIAGAFIGSVVCTMQWIMPDSSKSIPNPNEMTQKVTGYYFNDQWPQLCLWNDNDWTETGQPVQTHRACSQVQERMNQKVTLTLMKWPKKSLVIDSMTNNIIAAILMTQNGKVKPNQWGEQWCGPNPILVTSCPFGTASKMTKILTPTLMKWPKKSLVIS